MVNNTNAQQWLDEKYPKEGVCKRENDPENKNRKREDIIILDISRGKVGKGYFSEEKNLTGSLKLEGFTNLQNLIVSSHELTNLDVSECENLRELDCSNNRLNSLNINGCSKLKKINCVSNNCLEEVDIDRCPELVEIVSALVYDNGKNKLVKDNSGIQVVKVKENDVRNILIIGLTGGGKSTLSNVLVDTKQFKEGSFSTSVTRSFQESDTFEWQGKKYRVIDNIGFGDTSNFSEEDILYKIGEGIHSAKEGINQILFVVKGRFSPEHIIVFNSFKDFIAESKITEFTTIIRTNFKDFRSQQKCEEDREALLIQNEGLKELIDSCRGGIIYVDNPPIPAINNKKKEKSRKKVLDHLAENCQEIYKLKGWDSIYSKVEDYKKKKEGIEKKWTNRIKSQSEFEKERQTLAEEVRIRLGINPLTLDAFVEIAAKDPRCCSIS